MRLESEFIYARSEIDISNSPKTDFKVMILMHGLGDSLGPYKSLTQEINVTNCHYLLLNAPEEYFTGYAWYQPAPEDPEQAVKSPVHLILNEIKFLLQEGFKKEDIILAGFSQGGCMALCAAEAFGEKLGGVVALSPKTYPFMLDDAKEGFLNTPLFIAHGEQDPIIPFGQTKSWTAQITDKHKALSWHEYRMSHEIDIQEIHDLREWLNEIL